MAQATQILILAAGASSRMRGVDKLLQPVATVPLLRHVVERALASGLSVTVALPARNPARLAALTGLPVRVAEVAAPEQGLSASLRAGLAALPADAPVMLLLADMPDLATGDLQRMLAAWKETPDHLLRGAAADGTPGHPVCLPPWTRPELERLSGDGGAKVLFQRYPDRLRLIPLPGRNAVADLDTPEDWSAWRQSKGTAGEAPAEPKDVPGPAGRVA